VCSALDRAGIVAVLTGGSAATVYAPHAHQSRDLDFIIESRAEDSDAGMVLESLGYRRVQDHYEHSENPLLLEFPQGPLSIGGELIRTWDTMRDKQYRLHIISPTDCCRDRLAGFLFWRDRGSFEQAVSVGRAQKRRVDLEAVRTWCDSEGHADDYQEFERTLKA
jgi:hypothetical protein